MIRYVYDIKTLQIVARPIVKSYGEFKAEPTKFYPNQNITNHLSTETEFLNPIIDNEVIREKTREELILPDGKTKLLQDGEYISNNKIVKKLINMEFIQEHIELICLLIGAIVGIVLPKAKTNLFGQKVGQKIPNNDS